MKRSLDISGQKFGRWTVLRQCEEYFGKSARFLCRCDCRNERVVMAQSLRNGRSPSCGCLSVEFISQNKIAKKHGMCKTRVYRIWCAMRTCCTNPNFPMYNYYGGRGIKICDRWLKFENFYADMGEPTTDKHTLERKNSNGNYEPSNCKWATRKEQGNNTRHNRFIEFNGKIKTLAQWSDDYHIKQSTLSDRLKSGWPFVDAVTLPIGAPRTD